MRKKQTENEIKQEYSQGIARAVITLLLVSYLTISHLLNADYQLSTMGIVASYFLYSLVNLHHIKIKRGNYPLRKLINIVGDIGIISFIMYSNGLNAIVLYPVLLWIVVGNGMRFGSRYMFFALGFAEIAFTVALLSNPHWNIHRGFVYSLSIGLAVLSLFYAKLIHRMHHLNETLEEKVEERVSELKFRYNHDSLTNLKNRNALSSDLKYEPFSGLVVLDIDNFHHYNELYGMEIGNYILQYVSSYLQTFATGASYEVYRTYADHFVLRNTRKNALHWHFEEDVEKLFTEIDSLKIHIPKLDDELEIDITTGISLEKETALKKAEMALKYAKKKKKHFIAYSKMIDSSLQSQELLTWKNDIKKALLSDNIIPVYQAIVDRNQKVVKYEALMRLRRLSGEKEELISPFYFLDIAVKSKLYTKLTLVMIEKTFRDMKKNGKDFSINLSFEDIIDRHVTTILRQEIQKYDIGKQIIFEIVESENIDNFNIMKDFISEFKKLGVRIAIDDFGTGYSNFTHIFELAPDYLKIDGSLIKNIAQDKKSYELVKSIVSLSNALGIETIAEFVSSKEIFDVCFKLGVDQFQGYYFSEPIVENALLEFERSNEKSLILV